MPLPNRSALANHPVGCQLPAAQPHRSLADRQAADKAKPMELCVASSYLLLCRQARESSFGRGALGACRWQALHDALAAHEADRFKPAAKGGRADAEHSREAWGDGWGR